MRTIALIRADFMKQRHTPYFCIHSVIPVTGAILFELLPVKRTEKKYKIFPASS